MHKLHSGEKSLHVYLDPLKTFFHYHISLVKGKVASVTTMSVTWFRMGFSLAYGQKIIQGRFKMKVQ